MTKARRIIFVSFSSLMIITLIALGAWQLQRMQWKARIIEQSISALTAKPVTINDIYAGIEYGYDIDRLRIRLKGAYRHDLERYVYTPTKKGIGYQVITPFVDETGFLVFVDRGWVPEAYKDPKVRKATKQSARKPENNITITGITRVHAVKLTWFLADADLTNNVWYWYDPMTMANSLPSGVGETADGQLPLISPVFLQLEPKGEPGEALWPEILPIDVNLPNNHLNYAITWFLLALIIFVMLLVFLRSERRKRAKNDPR